MSKITSIARTYSNLRIARRLPPFVRERYRHE